MRDFTVQVVENPVVNRPIANSITALDAAVRASDCLATPLLSTFGIYCPTTIEQGEDSGLLVAQAKFNTQIRAYVPPPPFDYSKTYVKYSGKDEWVATPLSGNIDYEDTMPYYNKGVVEILFGTGLTGVGNDSFYMGDFPGLRKLVFADGCNISFSDGSFGGSDTISALENFENTTLESIGDSVFHGFTALSSISLPTTLQSIGSGTFADCTSLESVVVPLSCTSIGAQCFGSCTGLKNVVISNPNCQIGFDAFDGCSSLEGVEFVGRTTAQVREMEDYPWGIQNTDIIYGTVIDSNATYVKYPTMNHWVLTNLSGDILSSQTESLGAATEILIGGGVTSIGAKAFDGSAFPNLKRVEFGPECYNFTTIDRMAFQESPISAIVGIDNTSIDTIGDLAFESCSNLDDFYFWGSLGSIGDFAFSNTPLRNIYLPDGLVRIGNVAFVGCSNLRTVDIYGDTSLGEQVFSNCTSLESVNFRGITTEQAQEKGNYPWGISDTSVIHGEE